MPCPEKDGHSDYCNGPLMDEDIPDEIAVVADHSLYLLLLLSFLHLDYNGAED